MPRILALSLVALGLQYAAAQVSLVVPFADPQPLSADNIGVDTALDRTTWALHQGVLTGTFEGDEGSFPGTATLVEGSDYVSFTYVLADDQVTHTAGGVCSIQGGTEVCVGSADGQVVTETDGATPFLVQVTSTGVTSTAPSSATGASGSGAGAATGSSPESSAPSSTTTPNSAVQASPFAFAGLVGMFLGFYVA